MRNKAGKWLGLLLALNLFIAPSAMAFDFIAQSTSYDATGGMSHTKTTGPSSSIDEVELDEVLSTHTIGSNQLWNKEMPSVSSSTSSSAPLSLPTASRKKIVHELKEKRNLTNKHFMLEDGTYRAQISLSPVHYEDVQGIWQDIDTTLIDEVDIVDDGDRISKETAKEAREIAKANKLLKKTEKIDRSTTNFRALKVPFDVKLPKDYRKGYSIGKGLDKLSFKPIDANKSIGVMDAVYKNSVLYSDVWTSTDVKLTVTREGVKEDIILLDKNAPTSFAFELNTKLSSKNTLGELRLSNLWAEDANGVIRPIEPILSDRGKKSVLEFSLDNTGLSYPIIIDPTVQISNSGDTFYTTGSFTNNGGATHISLGDDGTKLFYALFKFDLSSLTKSHIITSAHMHYSRISYINNFSTDQYINVTASRVTSQWDEMTVNFFNAPPTIEYTNFNIHRSGDLVPIDVTNIIQDQVAQNKPYGIMLRSNYPTKGVVIIATKEMTNAPFSPAYLNVNYTMDIPQPTLNVSNENWINQNVTFTVTNSSANAGKYAKTQYQINSGAWTDYRSTVTVSTDGVHTIRARNVSSTGHSSNVVSKTIRIDKLAPNNPSTSNSVTVLSGTSVKLQWNAFSDPAPSSGIYNTLVYAQEWNGSEWVNTVDIDGNGTAEYNKWVGASTTSITISGLKANTRYRFIAGRHQDKAGNNGNYTWREVWTDIVAPTSPKISTNPGYLVNHDVTVTISSGVDYGSGVDKTQYKIGNGSWMTYTSPFIVTAEGINQVYARTVDKAGNISTQVSKEFQIDKQRPIGTSNYAAITETSLWIHWSFNDPMPSSGPGLTVISAQKWTGSSWVYGIDIDGDGMPETSISLGSRARSHQITGLEPGTRYRFIVDTRDEAGNYSTATWREVEIPDNTPPTAPTINISSNSLWHKADVTFTITDGTDNSRNGVRSQYRIGNNAWINYTSPITLSVDGSHLVVARTIDNKGNISSEASTTIGIDKQLPRDPSDTTSVTVLSDNSVKLQWQSFNDPSPSSGVRNARIHAQRWDGSKWVNDVDIDGTGSPESYLWVGDSATSFTINGLSPGTKYRFIAGRYRDNAGNDGLYTWREAWTKPQTPSAPTGTVHANDWAPQGTGYVNLTWNPVAGATGYKVWIFNGHKYEAYDVGNVTNWSTRNRYIFPSRKQVGSWVDNSQTAVFNRTPGQNVNGMYGELWDNPSDLYKKTLGTQYDNRTNYWFKLSAYNLGGESPNSNTAFTPTLENRTIVQNRYFYDANGRLDYMIKPDGSRIHYTYDKNGNLIEVSE